MRAYVLWTGDMESKIHANTHFHSFLRSRAHPMAIKGERLYCALGNTICKARAKRVVSYLQRLQYTHVVHCQRFWPICSEIPWGDSSSRTTTRSLRVQKMHMNTHVCMHCKSLGCGAIAVLNWDEKPTEPGCWACSKNYDFHISA